MLPLSNAVTGATIPFGARDDGGDIVETAFVVQGLLAARAYFAADTAVERELRERIDALCNAVEWSWYKAPADDVLLWHWSPNIGFAMNHPIRGWNECLIVYVLAAGSPTHAISPDLYERASARIAYLDSGATSYKMMVLTRDSLREPAFNQRPGGAINCIMAVSDIAGYLDTGTRWGYDSSAAVLQTFASQVVGGLWATHADVAQLLHLRERLP